MDEAGGGSGEEGVLGGKIDAQETGLAVEVTGINPEAIVMTEEGGKGGRGKGVNVEPGEVGAFEMGNGKGGEG